MSNYPSKLEVPIISCETVYLRQSCWLSCRLMFRELSQVRDFDDRRSEIIEDLMNASKEIGFL